VAYKADIDDYRESPALDIIKLLQARGAAVSFHDPWVPDPIHELEGVPRRAIDAKSLAGIDVAVVVTNHKRLDYESILASVPLMVDTRNVFKGVSSPKLFRI
jgi:UDP-N-acetyl-D-glucosamine dehydrogenase